MTVAPAVEECGHSSWTPVAPPVAYPYPDGHVCCAFRDRPFEVMSEARCLQASAKALNWPTWEARNGCMAPPDNGLDSPICCLTMHGNEVTDVNLVPLHECPSSGKMMPFAWCGRYRCIEGPAAENYPESSLGVLPTDSNAQSAPGSIHLLAAVAAMVKMMCMQQRNPVPAHRPSAPILPVSLAGHHCTWLLLLTAANAGASSSIPATTVIYMPGGCYGTQHVPWSGIPHAAVHMRTMYSLEGYAWISWPQHRSARLRPCTSAALSITSASPIPRPTPLHCHCGLSVLWSSVFHRSGCNTLRIHCLAAAHVA